MTALDPATLAAIRADAADHRKRSHPYCASCVEDIAQLCDEVQRLAAQLAAIGATEEHLFLVRPGTDICLRCGLTRTDGPFHRAPGGGQ